MSCWKLLQRCFRTQDHHTRWVTIRSFKFLYRYMHRSFVSLKPNTSRTQRPRLLLYGAVAFVWERERISNEHVMDCLTEYLNKFSPKDNDTPPSLSPSPSSSSLSPSSSPSPSSSDNVSAWNYLSWGQNILTWSSTLLSGSENKIDSPPSRLSQETGHNNDKDTPNIVELGPEQARKEKFKKDYMHYYRAHSEERMSQLPLVGYAKGAGTRRLTPGPRLMETIGELTKNKIQSVLSKYNDCLDSTFELSTMNSDLACIGGLYCAKGSLLAQDENWYRYYMELESEDISSPDTETFREVDTRRETVFSHVLKYLTTKENFTREIRKAMSSNLEHFKDQFSSEEHCHGNSSFIGVMLQDAVETTKQRFRERISDVLDHFYAESLILRSTCVSELDGTRRRQQDNLHCSSGGGGIDEGGCGLKVNSSKGNNNNNDILDWEFVTKDTHYVVYKKVYEDTGLFQYKVKGYYDDITAKDFCDIQVDQDLRRTWDTYAGEMVTVDHDEESNCKLIHWIMTYPFPMSSREYLFVQRSWTSADNDAIVIMNRSSSHPDVPETGKHVRVRDYFSDMVIKSRSHINELGIEFELTYFDCPRSQLPSYCVNWVASTAMPDFMKKIHDAAVKQKPS